MSCSPWGTGDKPFQSGDPWTVPLLLLIHSPPSPRVAHHVGEMWDSGTVGHVGTTKPNFHGLSKGLKGTGTERAGGHCKAGLTGLAGIVVGIWKSIGGGICRVGGRSSQGFWSAEEGDLCPGTARSATLQSEVFSQGMLGSLLSSGGAGQRISRGDQIAGGCHPAGAGLGDGQYGGQCSVGILQAQ